MKTVTERELRKRTRRILEQAEAGEDVAITVDGRLVARITRFETRRPRWITRNAFFNAVESVRADANLSADLDEFAAETTADS